MFFFLLYFLSSPPIWLNSPQRRDIFFRTDNSSLFHRVAAPRRAARSFRMRATQRHTLMRFQFRCVSTCSGQDKQRMDGCKCSQIFVIASWRGGGFNQRAPLLFPPLLSGHISSCFLQPYFQKMHVKCQHF